MGRKPLRVSLGVHLNGRHVGALHRKPDGATSFQYDDSWLSWANTFPISLSLPLRSAPQSGPKVMAVFENLLPDDANLRKTVAEHMGASGTDPH